MDASEFKEYVIAMLFLKRVNDQFVLEREERKRLLANRVAEGEDLEKGLDLLAEFPEMKGFSISNLKFIRQWYLFYSMPGQIGQQYINQFVQQLVAQIIAIPWGHNIAIISKCKQIDEALYYVHLTIQKNWGRSVLAHRIESGLFQREGKAVTNFALSLPQLQSDLAQQTLKDPYIFDFLTMTKAYNERDLENALVDHVAHFLLLHSMNGKITKELRACSKLRLVKLSLMSALFTGRKRVKVDAEEAVEAGL